MINVVIESLIMLFSSVSTFLVFTSILFLLQKYACKIVMNSFGSKSILISAIVGTPIHEISHLIVCVLFRHKIVKVVFFEPDTDGTLGYVTHSYNPMNLWHVIGNFFIGIAPLFGGAIAITVLTELLLPNGLEIISTNVQYLDKFSDSTSISNFAYALFEHVSIIIKLLLSAMVIEPFKTGLWFYLAAAIALHMSPSPSDLKGAAKGFLLLVFLIIFTHLTYSMIDEKSVDLYGYLERLILIISVPFSLCIALAALLTFFLLIMNFFVKCYFNKLMT